jgi:hypothetical protein
LHFPQTTNDFLSFVVANIDSVPVLNWYSAAGFSIYAEGGLKRYCLWSMTSFAQFRGNLYRDSRLAKQLETIADLRDGSQLSASAAADDPVFRGVPVQRR